MTEPIPTLVDGEAPDRPEPVLDAAKLAGALSALVVAVVGLVLLIVAGRAADLDALTSALNGIGLAIAAVVAYLAPVWQARKARAKVTPLTDPRDAVGDQLVPSGRWVVEPQVDGRADHAAPEDNAETDPGRAG